MKMAHREAGLSFLVGKLWVQILGRPPLAVQVWAILPTSLHLFSSICITIDHRPGLEGSCRNATLWG